MDIDGREISRVDVFVTFRTSLDVPEEIAGDPEAVEEWVNDYCQGKEILTYADTEIGIEGVEYEDGTAENEW